MLVYQLRNNVGSETNTQDLHRNRSAGSKDSMIQPASLACARQVRSGPGSAPGTVQQQQRDQSEKDRGARGGSDVSHPAPCPSLLLHWREGIPNFACARSVSSSSFGPWIRPSSIRDALGETFSSRFRPAAPIYLSNHPALVGSDLFIRVELHRCSTE